MRIALGRGLGALALALSASAAAAGCPTADRLIDELAGLGLERASRTARFGQEVPMDLYRSGALRVGEPVAIRSGSRAFGTVVVALPLAELWMAVNDEDHFDLDGRYLPVRVSEVIGGQPRGSERSLFQTFERWGVGRWWVSRVRMNEQLFRESEGRLWELYWSDEMEEVDSGSPPIASVAERMRPIEASEGSWLLVPLAADCTLIEYYTFSEPGGVVGLGQTLLARKGVLLTLQGILDLAREHVAEHDPREFVAPDGASLPR
jgi:hypothetical protein